MMEERYLDLKCRVVEKSSRTGNKYFVYEITFSPDTTLKLFPEHDSDKELIRLYLNSKYKNASE